MSLQVLAPRIQPPVLFFVYIAHKKTISLSPLRMSCLFVRRFTINIDKDYFIFSGVYQLNGDDDQRVCTELLELSTRRVSERPVSLE